MKNKSSHFKAYAFLFTALAATAANAALISNQTESFESGLGNWIAAGDVAIVNTGTSQVAMLTNAYADAADDSPLADGALNLSGTSPLGTGGDLEAALNIPVGSLDLNVVDQATEGSIISTTMNVSAGDILRFDWNLLTRDTAGLDYAFFSINGEIHMLGEALNAANISTGNYLMETGVQTMQYQFTSSGPVDLAFGVVDVFDYNMTTAMAVDNVTLASVPEPSSAAMFGALALGGAFLRKRRA